MDCRPDQGVAAKVQSRLDNSWMVHLHIYNRKKYNIYNLNK